MKKRSDFLAAILVSTVLGMSMAMADEARTSLQLDLPAQSLEASLRHIGRQTNINILIDRTLVAGLRAPALRGELTVDAAIARLLEGSGLMHYFVNENTVVLATAASADRADKQTDPGSGQAGARAPVRVISQRSRLHLVEVQQEDSRQEDGDPDRESSAATEIRVTGSRLRRDPAESDISPVTVFTRQEIERSGAATLADFVTRITQSAEDLTGRESSDLPVSGRTTVNLRGLGNNTTLVLLNGRRLPKTGQGFGVDDYNLNGIPIASIERIEVLTDGASAIYGSDAIAGVINIITRQNYEGLDVTVRYGNTFDTDVGERNANLTVGRNGLTGGGRAYSLTLNLGVRDRNSLAAADRPYTALGDYSATGGRPHVPNIFSIAGGAGSVISMAGPLPGLPVNQVAIPSGQDGRNLSIADFSAGDPIELADTENAAHRLLLAPQTERNAFFSSTLDLGRGAQWFVEASHFDHRSDYKGPPPQSGQIVVPATNPYNPFGVSVVVTKVFYELGPSGGYNENGTSRLATGLRGSLFKDWRYELYGDLNRSTVEVMADMPGSISFSQRRVDLPGGGFELVPTPGYTALNQTDPALALNVFGDGRTTEPNDLDLLRSLLGENEYRETSRTWTAALQADGTLAQLSAGPAQLALGAEFRKEEVDFYKLNTTGQSWASMDEGASRDVFAGFAELSVPLVAAAGRRPGLHGLRLNLAGRLDSESLFGEKFTPKVGLLWRPLGSLALRTTYSRGYKTPNLQQLFEPVAAGMTRSVAPPIPVDPQTGLALDYFYSRIRGGNPDLDPETSVSWSAGLIYEPVALAGLSVSVDYFDIDYRNKVTNALTAQDILNYFPERVTRDPVTGLILQMDSRAVNLSSASARGVDVRLAHQLRTRSRGVFNSRLNYTYNISNRQQTTPDSEIIENVDASYFPRVRASGYLFWSHGGFELGPTVTYESSTRNQLAAGAIAPVRIRRAIVVDLQASYDFGAGIPATEWSNGLTITLGIDNVFDRLPSPTDGAGGYAKVDPRQRRYYLSLRKHF